MPGNTLLTSRRDLFFTVRTREAGVVQIMKISRDAVNGKVCFSIAWVGVLVVSSTLSTHTHTPNRLTFLIGRRGHFSSSGLGRSSLRAQAFHVAAHIAGYCTGAVAVQHQ
jgi:hypothetical protein